MKNWRHEALPTEHEVCSCCGESLALAPGKIHDQSGKQVAEYRVSLGAHATERMGLLRIVLLGEEHMQLDKNVVALILENKRTGIASSIADPPEPEEWHVMNAEEVFSNRLHPLVFKITEFILNQDTRITRFLSGK